MQGAARVLAGARDGASCEGEPVGSPAVLHGDVGKTVGLGPGGVNIELTGEGVTRFAGHHSVPTGEHPAGGP